MVLWKGMATSIGQYAPVFFLENPPDREAWQARVPGIATCWTWLKRPCVHRRETFLFACGSSAPVRVECEEAQLLGLWGPWHRQVCRGTNRLCRRSCGPFRVLFRASASWQSEGLFGQCFSVAPPTQHVEGSLAWVLLCASMCQAHRGDPRLRPHPVDWCVGHLMGTLDGVLLCSSVQSGI